MADTRMNKDNTESNQTSGVNSFGFDLFSLLQFKNGNDNICASPFSIAMCFAMLVEGADGETKKQLMDTFHFSPQYLTQFEQQSKLLARSEAITKVANSLWMTNRHHWRSEFKSALSRLDAEIASCDFATEPESSVERINRWVNERTAGHVPSIIQEINPLTTLILVNVVYFDGKWLTKFDPNMTYNATFNNLDKSQVRVPTMHLEPSKFTGPYIETDLFSAVSLSYTGEDTSMYVLLPKENTTRNLEQLSQRTFLEEFFNKHRLCMKRKKVEISLPKFTFEFDCDLIPLLTSMGLKDVFNMAKSDLSKLTTENNTSYVSVAVHKTFFAVDEEGTKAAAVTRIDTRSRSRGPRDYEIFNADHPFVFVLYHHSTDQVLFIGRVTKLTEPDNSKRRRDSASGADDEERGRSSKKQRR